MPTERPAVWLPPAWTAPLPGAPALAELYHENSKYQRGLMYRQGPRPPAETVAEEPPGDLQPLPAAAPLVASLVDALAARRSIRHFAATTLPLELVATLLYHAAGPGRYPSAGGLYAVDLYLVAQAVTGLDTAVYRYARTEHALVRHGTAADSLWTGILPPGEPAEILAAGLWLFLVADFPRMRKYRARGYRFCLQEAGHVAQNVQLVAGACGLGSVVMGAFLDDVVADSLGLDGVQRGVLAVVPVGYAREAGRDAQ